MNKLVKRIGILAGVFLIASGIYFILAENTTKNTDTVYTTMEEASLPVVYTDVLGMEENRLPGYLQEMGQVTARDSLTVLPSDRNLSLRIAGDGQRALSLQYEIRSLDLNRLVERTDVTLESEESGAVKTILPIQNLLTKGTEYLLHLTVKTESHEAIHYYTRILLPQESYAEQMLTFARDFSEKTLDSAQAQSLVTYLESSSTADNSSLGHVTIESSFHQLTWAGLKMQLTGDMQVTMKELNGIMGQVQVKYRLSRETENGTREEYEVEDHYTMKWNPQRIYLMDFNRTANQIFTGEREVFSGKRILLGIGNDDAIQVKKSAGGQYTGYLFNRDLWCFDQKEYKAVKVFSFRSQEETEGRSDFDNHGIKILSVRDSGNMNFLVYGYMNRGSHEGKMGVSLYKYNQSSGAIEETFFIPVKKSYEALEQDLQQLSYLSSTDMLYLMIDSAVYGIDLSSNEYLVVADALEAGAYAISPDQHSLAWQEGTELYQAKTIHLLNLETGRKQEIAGENGATVRTLGFVEHDFVYGLAHDGDDWMINGRPEGLPMYALEIVDENLKTETRYEKPGYYLSDVVVEEARVHINRLQKTEQGKYVYRDEDTIVCNAALEEDTMAGIGWYASEARGRLYFVQMDSDIKAGKHVKVSVPKKVAYDISEELALKANQQTQKDVFYAYGQGHLQGSSSDFAKAVNLAYDEMGIVVDENQRIIWDRVNRGAIKTIHEPQNTAHGMINQLEKPENKDESILVLDARGCTLSQVLYFIDQGYPVVAYVEEGSYVLIYGFDQYNVSIYNPDTGQSYKMGQNDATEYFKNRKNDFVCGIAWKQ